MFASDPVSGSISIGKSLIFTVHDSKICFLFTRVACLIWRCWMKSLSLELSVELVSEVSSVLSTFVVFRQRIFGYFCGHLVSKVCGFDILFALVCFHDVDIESFLFSFGCFHQKSAVLVAIYRRWQSGWVCHIFYTFLRMGGILLYRVYAHIVDMNLV